VYVIRFVQLLTSHITLDMAHLLEEVRISMNSSRRVQPLPHDFLAALNKHHLTLRSLLIHLDPPVPATKSQPSLSAESDDKETGKHEAQLIHQMLSQATLSSEPHVPRNFPSLPSRHTFKAEAVFATPHRDQKQIRELATEEGRLGEEALRRLMSKKASGDDTLMTGLRTGSKLSFRQRSRALWRETYEEAVKKSRAEAMDLDGQDQDSEASSHLRPAVNADSAYWRKPIARKITETIPTDG
jgi:transcription initiation factor TFIID subunit 8